MTEEVRQEAMISPNDVKTFDFHGNQIRVVTKDNQPWFVLSDLAKVMEIKNTTILKNRLEQAGLCQTKVRNSRGELRPQTIVNKANMYRVIMRSDKPEAVRFQNWVTDVVLVAIDEHGGYLTPEKTEEVLLNPDTIIQGRFKTLDIPSGAILQGPHKVQSPGLLGADLNDYRSTLRGVETLYIADHLPMCDIYLNRENFCTFSENVHL